MIYLVQSHYADGRTRCGTDHAAIRRDLTTDKGALRWARQWLASRASLVPGVQSEAPTSASLEVHAGSVYGKPVRIYRVSL